MMDKDRTLSHLPEALGHKRLTRSWAKAEILFGLLAAGLGLFLGEWVFGRAGDSPWPLEAAGLLLFVLCGYLALAGHRSHLYQSGNELDQSGNELAAYLAEEIRSWRQAPR
jgi:hypothetical protein